MIGASGPLFVFLGIWLLFYNMDPLRSDTVFAELSMKTDHMLSDGSAITMAEAYKHFHPVAKCIGVGKDYDQVCGAKEGDWLLFPFHNVTSLVNRPDYNIRKTNKGRFILCCTTHIVQAVISEESKDQIMAGKKYINWESHAQPIGRKIFIKLDNQADLTESGIKIPDIAKRPVQTGTVIALGPSAHDYFHEEELSIGDRVLIPEQRSGGELPYQDFKKGLVIRLNSHEVICKMKEDTWVPVGGRLLIEPMIPEYQKTSIKGKSVMTGNDAGFSLDAYRIVGSKIIAPGTINVSPTIGKVVSVGGGWSKRFVTAASEDAHGPIVAQPGQSILMRPTYNSGGEIQYGNEHVFIGDQKMILLQANFVDAIITDEEFLTGYVDTKMPEASIYSGLGDMYGQ